jgi:hypothetical protein
MDPVDSFVFALALAGGIGVVLEIVAKDPRALFSLLRDAETFALEPAPATRPLAPQLRLELVGATATLLVAAALGTAMVEPAQAGNTLSTARDYHSRMLAGTSLGVR